MSPKCHHNVTNWNKSPRPLANSSRVPGMIVWPVLPEGKRSGDCAGLTTIIRDTDCHFLPGSNPQDCRAVLSVRAAEILQRELNRDGSELSWPVPEVADVRGRAGETPSSLRSV